jgi:hypothetical protein
MRAKTETFDKRQSPQVIYQYSNDMQPTQSQQPQPAQVSVSELLHQICPCKVMMFIFMCLIVYYLRVIAYK